MNPRVCLLAALFVSSAAWAQEPEPAFDLRSDAVRKIVRETAAAQMPIAQVADSETVKAEPAEFNYVPPEKPPEVREIPVRLPDPAPKSDGLFATLVDIAVDELLGIEGDDVAASNDMLRCRVQKETNPLPPGGQDNCPRAD